MNTDKIIEKIEEEYSMPFKKFISKYPERAFYSPDKNILFSVFFKLIENCEPGKQELDFFISGDKSYNFKVENFAQISEILESLNVTKENLAINLSKIFTQDIHGHDLNKPFFLKAYFFKGVSLNEYL